MRGLFTPFAALLLLPALLNRFGPIGLARRVTFFCAYAGGMSCAELADPALTVVFPLLAMLSGRGLAESCVVLFRSD